MDARAAQAALQKYPILCADPVPSSEIDAAEARLGRKFDADHREFIARYGGATVCEVILGLRPAEVSSIDCWSVVEVTERLREEFREVGWQHLGDWILISVDGGGNPIGILPNGEIWFLEHDTGKIYLEAPSFEAFVIKLLDR